MGMKIVCNLKAIFYTLYATWQWLTDRPFASGSQLLLYVEELIRILIEERQDVTGSNCEGSGRLSTRYGRGSERRKGEDNNDRR